MVDRTGSNIRHNPGRAFQDDVSDSMSCLFFATEFLVTVLEKLGVVWDVQLPSDAQIAAKLRSASEVKAEVPVTCE